MEINTFCSDFRNDEAIYKGTGFLPRATRNAILKILFFFYVSLKVQGAANAHNTCEARHQNPGKLGEVKPAPPATHRAFARGTRGQSQADGGC